MATRLRDKMKKMDAARRDKIEARAAELMAEEMSLRDLRRAHHLTQQRLAELLGVGQEGISRLEKRSDLLLSTLRGYLEAMGGQLRIVAEFPDRPPVSLSNFTENDFQAVSEDVPRRPARPRTRIT
ncbi:MAG: XRE family transcriptional regulator [Candidatus Tectomicrobia bacterium]|nr:XRE family transcriptional regulator [Candidatus Tectomicrobia bacterium]